MLQEARLQGLFARYVEHHVEHGDTLSVAELCQEDPGLRDRLQELIDDYHSLDRTLALPSALQPGDRVGSYRIVARLGVGGMGEVYEAEDLKLGRLAAIKVLHSEAASDRDRLRRFQQEARAASALNHPNIVTIYDIDSHDGAPYIAMEYVDGRTLGALLSKGRLALPRALDYAIQMADGLARAHAQGIVHRDLKPDNIMVTAEGRIKILDFGLAKLTEPEAGGSRPVSLDHPETREGHILGTAPYMSPEQAEGRPVDARSDIFSFGSVLYEMVTGHRPFRGDSSLKLLAAIVDKEPERAGGLRPSMPLELDRIIRRALQKEPDRRFQSTADLKVELLEVREELESGRVVSAEQALNRPGTPAARRTLWPWLVAALVLVATALGVWAYRSRRAPAESSSRTVQLTSLAGREQGPALSPDGRQVAFRWDGGSSDGPFELYVRLVDVGEPLQLTAGGGSVFHPVWSPEGSRIAFLRGRSGSWEIFELPALGGTERRLGRTQSTKGGIAWSPDGEYLAILDKESVGEADAIFLLSLATGERRRLSQPDAETFRNIGDRDPAFSPDGRFVAFVRQQRYLGNGDLYRVAVDSGEETRLTFDGAEISDVDWSADGRWLVFASERVGLRALWRVSCKGGNPIRLLVGEGAGAVSTSRQGDRLVYARTVTMINIYRVPGPAAEQLSAAEKLIRASGFNADPLYSPDGRRIVFASQRSGRPEIWTCSSEGEDCSLLTAGFNPSWSPDGRSIAYGGGYENSQADIYVIPSQGGIPLRLTEGSEDYLPSWSRDGRWLYYLSRTDRQSEIWKIPAQGGEPRQITHGGGVNALESSDGRYLYFATHEQTREARIWRMPLAGGESSLVVDWGPDYMNWDLWQDQVVYLDPRGDRGPTLKMIDPDSRQETEIVELMPEARATRGLSVSPDGQWIAFSRRDVADSDLVLVENFRLD